MRTGEIEFCHAHATTGFCGEVLGSFVRPEGTGGSDPESGEIRFTKGNRASLDSHCPNAVR